MLIVVRPPTHALFLKLFMLSEKSLDLILIPLDDLVTLSLELLFDLLELLMVVGSHIEELLAHSLNQVINVIILLFKRFNVFFIFLLKLIHELLDEIILLANNLLTGVLLDFDVFSKLLAVFLFFKLLPSPINLDILLVTCDDLSLDLVSSLFSLLFFLDTSVVLHGIGVRPDLGNDLRGFSFDLLQETTGLLNLQVS